MVIGVKHILASPTSTPDSLLTVELRIFQIPDCLALQGNLHTSGMYLYALNMTLTKPRDDTRACGLWAAWYHDERRIFGLLTGKRLPEVGKRIAEFTGETVPWCDVAKAQNAV